MIRRLALLVITIALGLATRRFPAAFPTFVAEYGGDTLWAAMVFWLAALVRPRAARSRLAVVALSVCVAVELSQLYRAPWIDALRSTRLGALALGHGFLWSDLLCYSIGVLLASAIDAWLVQRNAHLSSEASYTNH
jgi:hypothetical protein